MAIIVGSISGAVYGTAAESALGAIVENLQYSGPSDVDHLDDGQGGHVSSALPENMITEVTGDLSVTAIATLEAALVRGHVFTSADTTHFPGAIVISQFTKTRTKRGWMTGSFTGFIGVGYTTTTTAP